MLTALRRPTQDPCAESQVYCAQRKQARAPMKAISARQHAAGSPRLRAAGSPRLRRSLVSLRQILRKARPREVHADQRSRRASHVIYIDAEGSGNTAGVLFRDGIDRPLFFRWSVPASWYEWLEPRKTQIGVFEAAAAPVALASFSEYIAGSDLLLFIDNVGAQGKQEKARKIAKIDVDV